MANVKGELPCYVNSALKYQLLLGIYNGAAFRRAKEHGGVTNP